MYVCVCVCVCISCVCVCVCVLLFFFPFILDIKFVGRISRGHTGFLIHLPSAVRALIFLARRIQPFLSLVDHEVDFLCTNDLIVLHFLGIFFFSSEEKSLLLGFELTSHRVRRLRGYQLSYRGDRRRLINNTVTTPFQGQQGEGNPQARHKNSGDEVGAQMIQLAQAQLVQQMVNLAVSPKLMPPKMQQLNTSKALTPPTAPDSVQ